MLQKYDNWWQDKKLESDLEEQQRSNQVYNDPPKDNVCIILPIDLNLYFSEYESLQSIRVQ